MKWQFSCSSQGCRCTQNRVRHLAEQAKSSVLQRLRSHLLPVPWELPPGLRAWCQQCPKSLGAPEAAFWVLAFPTAHPVEQEYGCEGFAMAVLHLAPVGQLGLSNCTL